MIYFELYEAYAWYLLIFKENCFNIFIDLTCLFLI